MLRIEKKSRLSAAEVTKRALRYFGPNGLGLEVVDQAPTSVSFAGGGGGILVTILPDQAGTSVEVQSREWDYQAKDFLSELD